MVIYILYNYEDVGVRNFSVNQEIDLSIKAEQPALLKMRIRLWYIFRTLQLINLLTFCVFFINLISTVIYNTNLLTNHIVVN